VELINCCYEQNISEIHLNIYFGPENEHYENID